MKTKLLLLLTILSLNVVTAQEFVDAGIKYNITGTTVEVIANDVLYSGDIVIPATATDGTTTYDVTSIGEEAFYTCSSLTSVTMPISVTAIGDTAFKKCYDLVSATIPGTVTSIGADAFSECSSLTSITIPVGVTAINENAFYKCTSLETVTILGSVTSIGNGAFTRNSLLTSITIPDTVTTIGEQAFIECGSLTSITIPVGVTVIPYQAFYKCYDLESATILGPVTSIGEQAFSRCGVLTGITLPDSLTEIGIAAFKECDVLDNIAIPANVNSIGDEAFAKCDTGLSNVSVAVADPADITLGTVVGVFSESPIGTSTLTVPIGSEAAYGTAAQWSAFGTIVGGTLSTNDDILATSFNLYPNPVQNTLFIKENASHKLEQVSVYNVQGKRVLKSSKNTIDVTSLAKGLYFVKITTSLGNTTKKLIKN